MISFNCLVKSRTLTLTSFAPWQYPHVFEDQVLSSIKQWVIDDLAAVSNGNLPKGMRANSSAFNAMDREMLRTYATGLLAVALQG